MILDIPDHIIKKTGITPEELLLFLAIELFKEEKITLGQGSKLAGLHQIQFQRELAKRKIPIHYGIEEFEADLETLSKLKL